MLTETIDVTQDDIDNGERILCRRCPIARACNRKGFGPVAVCDGAIYKDDGKGIFDLKSAVVIANLPEEASRFYREFDQGKTVKPFSFQIQIDQGS